LSAVGFFAPAATVMLNVTPYTHIATGLAEYYISKKISVSQAIIDANAAVSRLLGRGIDVLATRPFDAMYADRTATLLTKEYAYGLYTSAFSAYAKTISDMSNAVAFQSITAIGLAQRMYKDIKDDGLLDGVVYYSMSLSGERKRDTLEYGSVQLNSVNYRHGLAQGILKIASVRDQSVRLSFEEMVHQAHYFAENTDSLFGTDGPAPFDADPPVFADASELDIVASRTETDMLGGTIIFVTYYVDVSDSTGVHRVAVTLDGTQSVLSDNIVPNGNRIELAVTGSSGVGAGHHTLTFVATDMLGNQSTKTYNIFLPDGKPTVSLKSPTLTNQPTYRAFGLYTDDGGAGIDAISVAVDTRMFIARLDVAKMTWEVDVPLSPGANVLAIRITDKLGGYREIERMVTLDNQAPDLMMAYSNVEFYRNGAASAGNLFNADAHSDPLYVPASRVGYANPTAPIADFDALKIPYYVLTVSDKTTQTVATTNAASSINVRVRYSVGGNVVTEFRTLRTSGATDVAGEARYVFPLIRQTLADNWYEAGPGDVHELLIEVQDTAGNVTTKQVEFKAFFDVPQLQIRSNIKKGRVVVHTFNQGAQGGRVGACVTDTQGQCGARLLVDAQMLHVSINDGLYAEYATNVDAPLLSGEVLSSVVDYRGGDASAVVTPYTHLGVGLIQHGVGEGLTDAQAYAQAVANLKDIYGFDVFTTVPADALRLTLTATPLTAAGRYAALLAGLSEWTAKVGALAGTSPHTLHTSVGAAQKFYADALADGLLDGVGLDANGEPLALTFGGVSLDGNVYRFEIASGALNFIARNYALSGPVMQQVLDSLQTVATNNNGVFAGRSPTALNAQNPIISLLSATTTSQASYPIKLRVTPLSVAVGAVNIGGVAAVQTTPNVWTADVALTQTGRNTLVVRVFDNASNQIMSQDIFILRDAGGPVLSITHPNASTNFNVSNPDFTLGGTATDESGVANVSIRLGMDAAQPVPLVSSAWTVSLQLLTGVNDIVVEAKDTLGNSTQLQVRVIYTPSVDTVPPFIEIQSPKDGIWINTATTRLTYAVTETVSLPVSTVVQVNGHIVTPDAQNMIPIPFEGTKPYASANIVTVFATDGVGNMASKSVRVNRDATPPVLRGVVAPSAVAVASVDFSVQVVELQLQKIAVTAQASGSVPVASEIILDTTFSSTVTSTAGHLTFNAATGVLTGTIGLGSGANTVVVSATDIAGNVSNVPFNVIVDAQAPLVRIANSGLITNSNVVTNQTALRIAADDSATGSSGIASVTFTGGGSTNARVVTANLGGVYTDSYVQTTDGIYTYKVVAIDNAGNKSAEFSTTLQLDKTSPVVNAIPLSVTSATLNGSIIESNLVSLTINGVNTPFSQTGVSNAFTYTLIEGLNNLSLVATDSAGNSTSVTTAVTFTPPDVLPPTLSVPTNFSVTATPVVVSGTASDAHPGTVSVVNTTTGQPGTLVNGSTFSNWSASVPLVQGTNVIRVTASDTALNTTAGTVTVNYTPPVAPAPAPTPVSTTTPTASPTPAPTTGGTTTGGTTTTGTGTTSGTTTGTTTGGTGTMGGTTTGTTTGGAGTTGGTTTGTTTGGTGTMGGTTTSGTTMTGGGTSTTGGGTTPTTGGTTSGGGTSMGGSGTTSGGGTSMGGSTATGGATTTGGGGSTASTGGTKSGGGGTTTGGGGRT
ncbi:MAG: Ig-like domain-containing protein, partial [Gammaproteobacteria bacterium]|nr:Ig-like domain-containing protein [Gammaproteobacteria bacterium]